MKNNNTIFVRICIVCTVVMTIALLCVGLVDDLTVRLTIAGFAALFVWGIYILHSILHKHNFSDQVIALLVKSGLFCKKEDDGGILVKQGDVVLNARLWNDGSHGIKRVHFVFNFTPSIFDAVTTEGWAMLAAECNASYDHTIVKFRGDHFCCMVETTVKNAKDFLGEYRFAYEKIIETMEGMAANADKVAVQFPSKKRKIGFLV